jgi:hypothetical protein
MLILLVAAIVVILLVAFRPKGPPLALAFLAAVCAFSGADAMAGGVLGGPFDKNQAELVGVNTVRGSGIAGQLSQVPDDDSGKWQVLLFTQPNCPPCVALKRAFAEHPGLKALASADGSGWATLNIYDSASPSQAYRFKDYEITSFPTVVITTPVASKQFPYIQIARYESYGGDAEDFASTAAEAITRFAAKYPPREVVAQLPADQASSNSNAYPMYQPGYPPNGHDKLSINLPNFHLNADRDREREREFPPRRRHGLFNIDWSDIQDHVEDFVRFAFWVGILAGICIVAYRLFVKLGFFARSPQPMATATGVEAFSGQQAAVSGQRFEATPPGAYRPSRDAVDATNLALDAKRNLESAVTAANEELARCAASLTTELQAVRAAKESLPAATPAA